MSDDATTMFRITIEQQEEWVERGKEHQRSARLYLDYAWKGHPEHPPGLLGLIGMHFESPHGPHQDARAQAFITQLLDVGATMLGDAQMRNREGGFDALDFKEEADEK